MSVLDPMKIPAHDHPHPLGETATHPLVPRSRVLAALLVVGMEYQQNQVTLPVAILVVRAKSNRMEDLGRAIPSVLAALAEMPPRTLRKLAA